MRYCVLVIVAGLLAGFELNGVSAQINRPDTVQQQLIKTIQLELLLNSPSIRTEIEAWAKSFEDCEWQILRPLGFESIAGAACQFREDHSIVVSGIRGDTDIYHVELECPLSAISAIRLEAIPDDSLPSQGSGRGEMGQFVLTELQAYLGQTRQASPAARYLRVEQEYGRVELHEVEILSRGRNIAWQANTRQSTTSENPNSDSRLAVDGDKTTCSTTLFQRGAWWEADLGSEFPLDEVKLWFHPFDRARRDLCDQLRIDALDVNRVVVWNQRLDEVHDSNVSTMLIPRAKVRLGAGSETASLVVPGEVNPYRRWNAFGVTDLDFQGTKWGWNPGNACKECQAAAFEVLGVAADVEKSSYLHLDILQNHGGGMLLGRFRVSACSKPLPVLSADLERALAVDAPARSAADWQALELYFDKSSRVNRGIDPQRSTSVEPDTDFPSDYAWIHARLGVRIRESSSVGDFDDALQFARRLLELEQVHATGEAKILAAAVCLAQLSEANGIAQNQRAQLMQIRDQAAGGVVGNAEAEWQLAILDSLLADWQMLGNDPALGDILRQTTREYLSVNAKTWLARRPASVDEAEQVADAYASMFRSTNLRNGFANYELGQCQRRWLKSPMAQVMSFDELVAKYRRAAHCFESAISNFDQTQTTGLAHAEALEGLAECAAWMGQDKRAVEVQQRAVQIYEEILGRGDIVFANAATNLAEYAINLPEYLEITGQFASHAAELIHDSTGYLAFVRARALAQAGLHVLHTTRSGQSIMALEESRQLYQSLRRRKADLALPPQLALALGQSYYALGRYAEARREWEFARENLDTGASPATSMPRDAKIALSSCLTSLGGFHLDVGALAIATPLLEESVELLRTVQPAPNHAPESYQTLAELKEKLGEWQQAEQLLGESLQLCEQSFGKASPAYILCLAQLGDLQGKYGRLDEALEKLRLARSLVPTRPSAIDPYYSSQRYRRLIENYELKMLIVLGRLLAQQGYTQESQEVLANYENLDSAHPLYDDLVEARVAIAAKQHDLASVIANSRKLLDARSQQWDQTVFALSESELLSLQRAKRSAFKEWFSHVAQDRQHQDPTLLYSEVWRSRGRVIREQRRRRDAGRIDPVLRDKLLELRAKRQEFADVYDNGDLHHWSDVWRQNLLALDASKEELERQIADRPVDRDWIRRDRLAKLTPGHLMRLAALDQVVLVEIVKYPSKLAADVEVYDAFILRGDDSQSGYSVNWIPLGNASEIDELVRAWRVALAPASSLRGVSATRASEHNPGEQLRTILWEPLEPYLHGSSTVVMIPEGALWKVPWGALPSSHANRYLIEDYAILNIGHGMELYDLLSRPVQIDKQVLFLGDVDFEANQEAWKPLAGSKAEIAAISSFWEKERLQILTGQNATKAKLREQMPNSSIIHLATHGRFQEPKMIPGTEDPEFIMRSDLITPVFDLPLSESDRCWLRSWLVTADGRVTASEIIDLDLSQVQLVVLSSCDSGLGRIIAGEGVFGIQRAFHVAGARTVVGSLWPVLDNATEKMMTKFHQNLAVNHLGRLASLREAQLAMLRGELGDKPEFRQPGAWSGWTLSGDWR